MDNFDKLKDIRDNYPELTLDNKGYETLSLEVRQKHADVIKELHEILKEEIKGFSHFNNFKPSDDNKVIVRLQYDYNWDSDNPTFIGVDYVTFLPSEEKTNTCSQSA